MEIMVYEMKYVKDSIGENSISCITFEQKYFQQYMKIYNACFYEMRKSLDIKPYNFLSDYEQIREKSKDIFLLVSEEEIIGSVACYGSEIDDLILQILRKCVNFQFDRKSHMKKKLVLMEAAIYGKKHKMQTN